MTLRNLFRGTLLLAWLTACAGKTDPGCANPAAATEQAGNEQTLDCPDEAPAVDPSCPCSRRACAPPSMSCPRGSGKRASATLGSAGGKVALSETGVGFSLEVFSGSLAAATRVDLVERTTPTPDDFVDWSPIYAVEPVSLELVNGGTLSVPYRVPHAGGGTVPRSIGLYRALDLEGPWERVADSYNNAGFVQATALGGGYFMVGYPKPADACE
ncbi:MAG TPA: hypothetical protein VGQ57_01330 [Polyangiaceae bacterium]|nr:hypothetical protein [Polyangiaceae bacterium]